MMTNLNNKLVAITGASSGIGAATAIALAAKGYKLLLLARRVHMLQQLLEDPSNALSSENTLIVECDVTNVDSLSNAVQLAHDKFHLPIDCLVNNAGVMFLQPLAEQSLQRQQQMISTNVMGVLNGIHVVLKDMIEKQHGTIINISSIAGKKSFSNHVAYCGTKFAVSGLTEALRSEVSSSKVRVIVIEPGVTQTELLGHNDTEQVEPYEEWKKTMTLGVLKAEDVAAAILFAYEAPPHVCVREIALAPTEQKD
ncbi:hypothetical protein C9374_001790 [Naegleria lovaniensis]|uniref:Oxidoreductase n=1 Tax=Naegleria lovaniensis TaxID=51637 RepID=A0AA88KMD4_NAELO|nr:uncharacterized protein C9374_001790 [Naegleria lovaniensis]KAG2387458.1 hypothetical protein C9374_001790 [Naegleria lovaniensis]